MKKIIVVKLGSSVITDLECGVKLDVISKLLENLKELKELGYSPVVVSSGAVASGKNALKENGLEFKNIDSKALAALGQPLLVHTFIEEAKNYDLTLAQLLLSKIDFIIKDSYQNALNTFNELLKLGIIPIINENDSVAKSEKRYKFGDNDMLSALVASLLHAEKLIIITDAKGVFDKDPSVNKDAKLISYLDSVSDELVNSIGENTSSVGTGGMYAKLIATRLANLLGINVYIGKEYNNLRSILSSNAIGTYIESDSVSKISREMQWLAFHGESKGSVVIDDGAIEALVNRKASLLPVGIKTVNGNFKRGALVEIYSLTSQLIAKGKANFSSDEALKVIGMAGSEVKNELSSARDEFIHRDNLFLLNFI